MTRVVSYTPTVKPNEDPFAIREYKGRMGELRRGSIVGGHLPFGATSGGSTMN